MYESQLYILMPIAMGLWSKDQGQRIKVKELVSVVQGCKILACKKKYVLWNFPFGQVLDLHGFWMGNESMELNIHNGIHLNFSVRHTYELLFLPLRLLRLKLYPQTFLDRPEPACY